MEVVSHIIMEVGVVSFNNHFHFFYKVGKIRKRWVKDTLTPTGIEMIKAVKQRVDPNNIFACGNLLPS